MNIYGYTIVVQPLADAARAIVTWIEVAKDLGRHIPEPGNTRAHIVVGL